jgi:hypothetical protein
MQTNSKYSLLIEWTNLKIMQNYREISNSLKINNYESNELAIINIRGKTDFFCEKLVKSEKRKSCRKSDISLAIIVGFNWSRLNCKM